MDDGNSKRILSIDRAAFLLLRVKKAFKKKRQQRKDRILLLQNNEAITSAAKYKRTPPPLLRSRTLPAILQDKSNQVPKFTTGNVPPPHIVAAHAYLSPTISVATSEISLKLQQQQQQQPTTSSFYRFTRFLNSKPIATTPLYTDETRRLSWEKRIPRSTSIDSMVDLVWNANDNNPEQEQCNPKNLTVNNETPSRRESLLSPRRTKHNENQENYNVKSVPKDYSSNQMNQNKVVLANNQQIMSQKMNKKHKFRHSLKEVPEQNLHLHALFAAVEHGHLDKVRTILESTDVDINSVNSDGLSTLDVSVLSNNRSMTKLLLQHGALSGPQSSDNLGNYLNSLMFDAEQKVHDLAGLHENPIPQNYNTRASFSSIIGSSSHSCTGTENDKQIGLWERRIKGLKRMILGWEQSRPPDPPFSFTIDVIGTSSVMIKILEPTDDSICTKFKVQWSSREDFSNIIGERLITEWNTFQGTMGANFYINELIQGRRYYFRACSGNIKGFGPYKTSDPTSLIPSSWRDIDRREHRFTGRQRMLDELLTAVRLNRPDDASEIPDTSAQRRNPKKKTTIKQLFSAASKFQKNLRRGIYLACIMYYDDKILVTNEDFLPVIEIDETYPSNFNNEYYWLMKVSKHELTYIYLMFYKFFIIQFLKIACTWDDVKLLRSDMEKNPTSAIHFRTKLLGAVHQMQSALCISDLGQFYHKPLRDSHGTVVLCCIHNVKNPKVSVLNSRWVPINKIQKKLTMQLEDSSMNEILLNSIQEQINYNQTSNVKLSRGLYLGYLKMQSSFEHISLVVPTKTPNVLPHCKIRDNPHISAEEWSIIKSKEASNIPLHFDPLGAKPTEVQENFLESLTLSSNRLFKYMNVTAENSLLHRLFDVEVIELNHDVSFLVICPPADSACAIPGQTDFLLKRTDLMCLPLIPFEMIHLRTYQHNIIQKYSRLSCIIELDVTVANQNHREAFSSSEVQTTKERLVKLQDLMNNLNTVWKSVRWLMDVISFARDKDKNPELDMKKILEFKIAQPNHILPHSHSALLEPPSKDCRIKSPTRGSWPGPSTTNSLIPNSNTLLCPEHSKSEQQLLISSPSSLGSRHLSVASCLNSGSRKNSGDSAYSNYYSSCEQCDEIQPRLPPSKSEDTLVVIRKKGPTNLHRKRATTTSNPTTMTTTSLAIDGQASVKSGSLIVHRKNVQSMIETEQSDLNTLTPNKTKLRVSHHPSNSNCSTSRKSDCKSEETLMKNSNDNSVDTDVETNDTESSILQVFAAYDTGLASGTSLKLRCTQRTTAREVIDLVVKQLNMAVVLKGKDGPVYEQLDNFCLVAVIGGARERCLRDDFKPLQLQNPWQKGKLYVRLKNDLLAAIEHSNRETFLI
ncbi:unnamed protein product [Diamesa serratosioi]